MISDDLKIVRSLLHALGSNLEITLSMKSYKPIENVLDRLERCEKALRYISTRLPSDFYLMNPNEIGLVTVACEALEEK